MRGVAGGGGCKFHEAFFGQFQPVQSRIVLLAEKLSGLKDQHCQTCSNFARVVYSLTFTIEILSGFAAFGKSKHGMQITVRTQHSRNSRMSDGVSAVEHCHA